METTQNCDKQILVFKKYLSQKLNKIKRTKNHIIKKQKGNFDKLISFKD